MALSPEQAEEIKKQLLSQVEKLPQENKGEIKQYIEGLDEQGLEEFLKQNKIQVGEGTEKTIGTTPAQQCVFCSIVKGEIPAFKITENKKSIAILEINPLSKGHSIVIPLKHISVEEIPKSAMSLAQKIAKRIKKKLKPEDIKIETSNFMSHAMINVIPIYKDVPLKKIKADEKDLKLIQSKLEVRKRSPRKNKDKESSPGQKQQSSSKNLREVPVFRVP